MKYTARHIRKFLETGKIDATLWQSHFPSLLPSKVPGCEDCSEFLDRTCSGGRDAVECFLARSLAAEPAGKQRQKRRDPLLGLGMKEPDVHGMAKPRDQSKM